MPVPAPITSQNVGHYDAPLTTFGIAYMQSTDNFVAQRVFPPVPVANASDVYPVWPRGNFYRDDVAVRPMGGRAPLQGVKPTWASYTIEEEALAATIDDRERANQTNPINMERAKTRMLLSQHLIHADRKFAAAFMATSIWGTDVTGVASGPTANQTIFWNLSTSDPVVEVRKRKRAILGATGIMPNVLVLGSDVELALLDNAAVISRISGGASKSDPALVELATLEQVFGCRIVVGRGVWNSAIEEATATMGYILPAKSALLAYAAPNPGIEEPSAGYTFAWNGLLGGQAAGVSVKRWREEGASSDFFQASTAHTQKVVAADLGVFFSLVVQ